MIDNRKNVTTLLGFYGLLYFVLTALTVLA